MDSVSHFGGSIFLHCNMVFPFMVLGTIPEPWKRSEELILPSEIRQLKYDNYASSCEITTSNLQLQPVASIHIFFHIQKLRRICFTCFTSIIPSISALVGGLEHVLFSHSVGNFIIPIDELIFFQGCGSTTNQSSYHRYSP